jgi:hypothetical protein
MRGRTRHLYLPVVAAALVAAGAAGTARAATGAGGSAGPTVPPAKPGASAHHRITWVMGNIIEAKKDSLAINTENGRMRRLKLNGKTDIVVDGKRASATALEPGAPVMASYEGTGAHAVAKVVTVDERAMQPARSAQHGAAGGAHMSSGNTR